MTKILYLLRHAKSSWKIPELGDFDRPLNKRGRDAAGVMARLIRRSNICPDLVLCSGAARTRETLKFVAKRLPSETTTIIDDALYLATEEELLARVQEISDQCTSAMIIGHNPGIADLGLWLSGTGSKPIALATMAAKYPTGALAVLHGPGRWKDFEPASVSLSAFVKPKDLENQPKLKI